MLYAHRVALTESQRVKGLKSMDDDPYLSIYPRRRQLPCDSVNDTDLLAYEEPS